MIVSRKGFNKFEDKEKRKMRREYREEYDTPKYLKRKQQQVDDV